MMERNERKIAEAVEKDDVKAFSSLVGEETFSFLFGRFPILSLCYLFGAKRIVKAYEDKMIKERGRVLLPSYSPADALFIKKAGKTARFFIDKTVSPLEMLAVLGENKKLKNLFARYPRAEAYLASVNRIYYTRLGKNVVVKGKELILPPEPLSFAGRRRTERLSLIFFVLGVFTIALTAFIGAFFGTGGKIPYKVRNGKELAAALSSGASVRLERTITLSETIETSSSEIDGNGNTIRLSAPLFKTFSGKIRNVNFYLLPSYEGSGVIGKNEGTISDVSITAESLSIGKKEEYQGALVNENAGIIESSYLFLTLSVGGEGGGNCYFGSVCGSNSGTIHNCRAEGEIKGENVDLGGIAGSNDSVGTISDCYVNLSLAEASSLSGWTPNVAGIAVENLGAIYRAENAGKIEAKLSAPALAEGESPASAYAAGIVCVNVGSVTECKNEGVVSSVAEGGHSFSGGVATINGYNSSYGKYGVIENSSSAGEVLAKSVSHNAYAGGIAANNSQGARITSCRQTEKVKAESEGESLYSFAGGIAGYNAGGVETSVYTASCEAYSETVISGAICGATYLRGGFFTNYTISLSDNAFVKSEEGKEKTSGAIIAENGYRALRAGAIYTAYQFESQKADAIASGNESTANEIEEYLLPLLSLGAEGYSSEDEIPEVEKNVE